MTFVTKPANNGQVCPDFSALVNLKTFVPSNLGDNLTPTVVATLPNL